MAAQKRQKKTPASRFFFGIFECLFTPKSIQTMLSTLLIDSSRSYKRPLENQKTEGSRELFLPENDFQTSSIVNFPKNIEILETRKPKLKTWNSELILFSHNLLHMNSIENKNCLIGTSSSSKCHKFSKSIYLKNNFLSFIFLEVLIVES